MTNNAPVMQGFSPNKNLYLNRSSIGAKSSLLLSASLPLATLLPFSSVLAATTTTTTTSTTKSAVIGDLSASCDCLFQGSELSDDMINNYPSDDAGKYSTKEAIKIYGTTCAAWDSVTGTPWYDSCKDTTKDDWKGAKNWCQSRWCYVSPSCEGASKSDVFKGSTAAYFSYEACGNKDCYTDATAAGCPNDVNKDLSYKPEAATDDKCKCKYNDETGLPTSVTSTNANYASLGNVKFYGISCAAWDSIPNTPYFDVSGKSCNPANNPDWCHSDHNWCQVSWCYVDQGCAGAKETEVWTGQTLYYSYQTCNGNPNCYPSATGYSGDKKCPYDVRTNHVRTAKQCGAHYTNCQCSYQGKVLPTDIYTNYPNDDAGKYKGKLHISLYGTGCAAWDQIPGTPWYESSCKDATATELKTGDGGKNWCNSQWCYVDSTCPLGASSDVFKGSTVARFSYEACGNEDCYAAPFTNCPNDVTQTKSYAWHKGSDFTAFDMKLADPRPHAGDCSCKFFGSELTSSIYNDFPSSDPGKYKNLDAVKIYGSSCAAWDSIPGTPWVGSCNKDNTDFCSRGSNWCATPWCYVDKSCSTGIKTDVFSGSDIAYYSYDTCHSTPDCYGAHSENCPFDSVDSGFNTLQTCKKENVYSDCSCAYQGSSLPASVYTNFPNNDPGKYKDKKAIMYYGSQCAAWDRVPDTPWETSCDNSKAFDGAENWCTSVWCYVHEHCTFAVKSDVFKGSSTAFFSYEACGAANCYADTDYTKKNQNACPNDPTKTQSYKYHKKDGSSEKCACLYEGAGLAEDVYKNYPSSSPGKYKDLAAIKYYGHACASWDQMPNTPWASSCPGNAGDHWCSKTYNWCQAPWCYVDSSCPGAQKSSVFDGSTTAHFSYDTCRETPDCYTGDGAATCPFDKGDNSWNVAKVDDGSMSCADTGFADWKLIGTTTTSTTTATPIPDDHVFPDPTPFQTIMNSTESELCACTYQGKELPSDLMKNYPEGSDKGKYNDVTKYPGVHLYGTQCAGWDLVPGTPFHDSCKDATHDGLTGSKNWCSSAWCYVLPSCPNAQKSDVFKGSATAYYSYETCGAVNCYTDANGPGCPNGGANGKASVSGVCDCLYSNPGSYPEGLPESLWKTSSHSGKKNTKYYGTTCNAWDSVPATPWNDSCKDKTDFCDSANNWCETPWCYVSPNCPSAYQSDVFPTQPLFYSYNACNSPRCYGDIHEEGCPFDKYDSNWYTRKRCAAQYSNCQCKYPGQYLPDLIINDYPTSDKGKYKDKEFVKLYGTACAAWDNIDGTPWFDSCKGVTNAELKTKEKAWCGAQWCYVDESCPKGASSSVFEGSTVARFSYEACGFVDCYSTNSDGEWDPRCPFDPTTEGTYQMHKGGDCECKFSGAFLPDTIYKDHPTDNPGQYRLLNSVKIYGSQCAAWDSMPDTPWKDSCTGTLDFCSAANNWCATPWCYVDEKCPTAVGSDVFKGSTAAFYSYDTCRSTPNCYAGTDPRCPFDSHDNDYNTQMTCRKGNEFSDCSCKFQGMTLDTSIFTDYPIDDVGKYKDNARIGYYGTSCAAWDRTPDTPWFSYCPNTTDFQDLANNWCTSPWCYVDESCTFGSGSDVFKGSGAAFFSYEACGVNNCYADTEYTKKNQAGCPNDPTETKSFKYHKKGDCECLFEGKLLAENIYKNYPSSDEGKYKDKAAIAIYGTSCAQWDQMPGTLRTFNQR